MKKHTKCLWCLSLKTQRWGTRKTKERKIQKFKCLSCGHIFSKRITKGLLSAAKKVEITRQHLEGRTSIRQLVRDTSYAKQTIQNAIHEVTRDCVSSAWIAQNFHPNWGGYLAVDGTVIRVWDWSAKHFRYTKQQKRFLHKLVWIVALDLETLDIVHHHLADEESMVDLVLFYQQVKQNGYPLKGLVSDGNLDIRRAAEKVFGEDFSYQLCVRHYLETLRRAFKDEILPEEAYIHRTKALRKGVALPELPVDLFTYQTTPLPRTNQQIENLFRQVKLRTRSMGQFHGYHTADAYLNAWSLFRRFTPFTDCRNPDKNRRAPLELAGCNIHGINYLDPKTNLFLGR